MGLTRIKRGEWVKWTSQAQGSAVEKVGTLTGYHGGATWRRVYMVAVTHVGGKKLRAPRMYTPLAGVVDKANPKAKREPVPAHGWCS